MPARSKAQEHLMAAAAHGAKFPMARKVRSGMSLQQLAEFEGSTKGLPKHVKGTKAPSRKRRTDEYASSYPKAKR